MKRKIIASTFIILTAIMSLSSCANKKADPSKYLPSISGNAGDVLIVINKAHWEGEIGTRLREILACEYPHLPQREPYFILYNTPHSEFSGSFLVHRNIVMVNISNETDSSKIILGKNIWAKPQLVIKINAKTEKEAADMIRNNGELIANTIEQAERDRIMNNSKRYQDASVREAVIANIGGSPYFPRGFTMKTNKPDFMWISQETTHVNQGILIFKYPYTGEDQFCADSLKQKLNDLWKKNVPGMRDDSYMTFNKLGEPGIKNMTYHGMTFTEVRGLWEVENDFMGGPLICHVFPDKTRDNIIILNAFVYAPKYDKRKYLRQVESIIYSFEWK